MNSKMQLTKKFDDLLDAIDVVNVSLDKREPSPKTKAMASDALKYLSERMKLTQRQCSILAMFVESYGSRIDLESIARQLNVSNTRMLRYSSDLDELENRGFIYRYRRDDMDYRMPMEVLESFKRDEVYVDPCLKAKNLSLEQLFCEMATLFSRRDNEELSINNLYERLERLINNNKHLDFAKQVAALRYRKNTKILLLFFCHSLVNENDYEISSRQVARLFGDRQSVDAQSLTFGNHTLQKDGLVEFGCSHGFADNSCYCLTDKAKQQLLAGIQQPTTDVKTGLKDHTEIVAKELFYNDEDVEDINTLFDLLTEEKYQLVLQRLKDHGLRPGFTCLFYGSPGTGKTETVLQLAKRTGRDIMQVDISAMRSKWVGESEKNIKAVFDNYRNAASRNEVAPILLFNEADAVLNVRKEGAQQSVEKMENTMQNIILEELERFDGIFIATTNLATNLDPAFERRFLFKVNFHRPTPEVRSKIWKTMLPKVDDEHLLFLAAEFDLSGGQIENIARQYIMNDIRKGSTSYDDLRRFCRNERLGDSSASQRKVGFA